MPAYPRPLTDTRICDRLERGWTLSRLTAEPGFPSRRTVWLWARSDPAFARRLREAQAWSKAVRGEPRAAPSFDPATAERLLARVRHGERLTALIRLPEFPNRARLNRWKRERPDFAAELAAACAFARSLRRGRWARFDPPTADRIVVALSRGERLADLLEARDLPSAPIVRRWARAEPDFATALKFAKAAGHAARMAARRKLTPQLAEEVCDRLTRGQSLAAIATLPHMPSNATLHAELARDPDFARMVRWAREDGRLALLERAQAFAEAARHADPDTLRFRVGRLTQRAARMAEKPANRRRGWQDER